MNKIQKYSDYFFQGEWHIHTSYTDGKNSVCEYAEKAIELGIPLLAFTEHVREKLDYDFFDLLHDIEMVRKKFPKLIVLSGIEAKVLPDGRLDCPYDILEKVDYKLFAFHSFPSDIEKYSNAVEKVVCNYDVNAWAHPGVFFKKNRKVKYENSFFKKVSSILNKNHVYLEFNLKYGVPELNWIQQYLNFLDNNIIFGADAHSIDDLVRGWKIKQEWLKTPTDILSGKLDPEAFIVWFIENYSKSV